MRWIFLVLLTCQLFSGEKLTTQQISLGGQIITVEIASTPEERAEGLKNRGHLPKNQGMLFVFEEPRVLSFWMKDTQIPLSIGFFDEQKVLLHTEDMQPEKKGEKIKIYRSDSPALYALEMPLYWFKYKKIQPGMKFSFHEQAQ